MRVPLGTSGQPGGPLHPAPFPVGTERCALPPEDDLPRGRHGAGTGRALRAGCRAAGLGAAAAALQAR